MPSYLSLHICLDFDSDALLIGFSMASQTPGTSVYALDSSFGVSLGHNSQPDPSELGGVQSSFAVSGSLAEARILPMDVDKERPALVMRVTDIAAGLHLYPQVPKNMAFDPMKTP